MTLIEIASIYTDLVKAEQAVPAEEVHAKDELCALRSKYHQLLMSKMREEGVEYSDRFDAAAQAFALVNRAGDSPQWGQVPRGS